MARRGKRAGKAATGRNIKKATGATIEKTVLKYVNIERKKRKLPPYSWNSGAARAAREHSQLMIREGRVDHVLPGEPEVESRVKNYVQASLVMENIGASCGPSDVDSIAGKIVHFWVWDDASWNWGHRHNVLDGITSDPGHNNKPADYHSNPYGYHNYGMNQVGIGAKYGTIYSRGTSCKGWVVTMDIIKILTPLGMITNWLFHPTEKF